MEPFYKTQQEGTSDFLFDKPIEVEIPTPVDEKNQYLIDEAKYIENGSINLVSTEKIAHYKDTNEMENSQKDQITDVIYSQFSNKSIGHIRNDTEKDEFRITDPTRVTIHKDTVKNSKAVFRRSGEITSREQRARTISLRKGQVYNKRKVKLDPQTYAIDYTEQEDQFHNCTAPAKSEWSSQRFKRYPRFTIFLSNCKHIVFDL